MMKITKMLIDMDFKKYSKFPKLKKFLELGKDYTPEGAKYLRENPDLYNEKMEWESFFQFRRILGNNKGIHYPTSVRS